MGFLDKLQSKFELYKLEQRYTKRKRRTTFISDATYVERVVASTFTTRDNNHLHPRDPAFEYPPLLQVARVLHDSLGFSKKCDPGRGFFCFNDSPIFILIPLLPERARGNK
ncbi:hypothetical protein K440DRAFT_170441 [Wilcoxina mikolae CBS 423.85]|nr:hypothetical protein K440DRAFT_170441 [Wilcoxina mikolae CBS 423.85]